MTAPVAGADPPKITDGRLLRGARTRQRIIEALLDLLVAGNHAPTAAQIAAQASTSVRSVFQHFTDLEALYAGLAAEQATRVAPLLVAPPRPDDLGERIRTVVDQRSELYETIAPVRHAMGNRANTSPALAARLAELSAELRRQVEVHFAPELDRLTGARRRQVLDALDLLTSFEAWDRLRTAQSLERDQAGATLVRALTELLA